MQLIIYFVFVSTFVMFIRQFASTYFHFRYLLCELVFPDKKKEIPHIDTKNVYLAVRDAILEAHGDYGLGAVQFSLSGM